MTEPTPKSRPAVFIEKIFPVNLLNQQVYYEHGGNPFKGLHRWYSRKPLSFSRASVLGSLLPDTVTMEEFEYLLGLNRRVSGHPDSTTKLYKTPPSPERIKQVHDLCEQIWGTRTPTVLDAFAGGGSIPFEAVRYGLNVLASDLNPVAVVTMKAAMEYPLKFGPDLQHEIDKWVKWVGDEAEKRLAEFFPSGRDEKTPYYLWTHTIECPSCGSVTPLCPTWWVYNRPEKQNWSRWCAIKPSSDPSNKTVALTMLRGTKGQGKSIETDQGDYDPNSLAGMSRGLGKCLNCDSVIETDFIYEKGRNNDLGHQLFAVAFQKGQGIVEFRTPNDFDLEGLEKVHEFYDTKIEEWKELGLVPDTPIPYGHQFAERSSLLQQGVDRWDKIYNKRQFITVVTYLEILGKAKSLLESEYEPSQAEAILVYLTLVLDRSADKNCKLAHWQFSVGVPQAASGQHSLNLMWSYPEVRGHL